MDRARARIEILRALANGPATSLGIHREARIGQGALYPALWALHKDGLVTRTVGTVPLPERGYRPQVIYELTEAGRARLRAADAVDGA